MCCSHAWAPPWTDNLAVALKESAGDNAGALRLLQEVLAVRRRLGDDHPATLDSVTNLALQVIRSH